MKVGYVQFKPELNDVQGNLARILGFIRSNRHADLLVFPELCVTGYAFRDRAEAGAVAEPVPDGPSARAIEAAARECGTAAVVGMNEMDAGGGNGEGGSGANDGPRLHNTAAVFGKDGYAGKYRKCHLFWNELDIFTPGDRLDVFELDMGGGEVLRLGVLICFDWIFPEAWRTLAVKGADAVCCPSNLILPGLAQKGIPAHALFNRYYTILANRTGEERDLRFTGLSLISGIKGEILAEAGAEEDSVGIADIDPAMARDKNATPRNHILDDRRPEIYFR